VATQYVCELALCGPAEIDVIPGHPLISVGPRSTICISEAHCENKEMLRLNGYSTGAFGKWHETAAWETSVSGPFDRWPTRQGFDKFYGFIGGETDQWSPLIYDGVVKVNPPKRAGYHFTEDMTDQAINWIKAQQSLTPDKPFFAYFATGAVHAPHHVPKEWIEKFHGQFDEGWDQVRETTFERQKEMRIIPADTQLPPMPKDLAKWASLPEGHKKLFRRQAEVFAAFMAHTDHHVGRLPGGFSTGKTGRTETAVFDGGGAAPSAAH
jgi:arylsulfatase